MNSQHVTSGKRGRRKPALDPHINRYKANIGAPFYCYVCKKTHRNIAWLAATNCVRKVFAFADFEKLHFAPYLHVDRDEKDQYRLNLYPDLDFQEWFTKTITTNQDELNTILGKSKVFREEIGLKINPANILAVPDIRPEMNKLKKDAVAVIENHLKRLQAEILDIVEELKCQRQIK